MALWSISLACSYHHDGTIHESCIVFHHAVGPFLRKEIKFLCTLLRWLINRSSTRRVVKLWPLCKLTICSETIKSDTENETPANSQNYTVAGDLNLKHQIIALIPRTIARVCHGLNWNFRLVNRKLENLPTLYDVLRMKVRKRPRRPWSNYHRMLRYEQLYWNSASITMLI